MNAEQIQFNKRYIKDAVKTIAELRAEIAKPNSRPAKNRERERAISDLNAAIADCLKRLFDAGVVVIPD